MTSFAQSRCRHCGIRYSWQASGWGASEDNDAQWCPDCYRVIREALSEVPRRVQKVWVDASSDYPPAPVLHEQEQTRIAELRAGGNLVARRVAVPLFDMNDPSNQNVTGFAKRDGVTVRYGYWTKDPEGTSEVRVPMEKDLETGDLTPWVEIKRR